VRHVIPPFARRCPDCGHRELRRGFERVGDDGATHRVECPACGHRFEPVEHPWLN
jgi:DNA-directed RNA polymerase subunit RPC12/RpoP